MLVIGLTGNIGSGKSLAAACLRQLGALVIDADQVAHEIIAKGGAAYQPLLAAFGNRFLDAERQIRRRELGAYVFADKSGARARQLNAITHPPIRREISRLLKQAEQAGYAAAAVEAALLLQSELMQLIDEVWVIIAPRETLIARVTARDGCEAAAVIDRLEAQPAAEELISRADRVFVNDSAPEDLCAALSAAYAEAGRR